MKNQRLLEMTERNNRVLGEKVKKRRQELGLTQTELAIMIGYSHPSSIQKLEAGERGIPASVIDSLAKALYVPSSFFYGNDAPEDNGLTKDMNELIGLFRLLDKYERAIVIDAAKSVYRNSTLKTKEESEG